MQYDVFLSYSRKDIDMMRRVRDDLRAAGLRVWTDEALEPGTEVWESEIEKAIRDASSLVVLLSPDAYASEWVRNEITLADTLNRRIVPLLIRGEQGDSVPLRLIASQRIDARADYPNAINQLTTAVKNEATRSHAAVTVRTQRIPRSTSSAADIASSTSESAQIGGVRISLAMGVAATLTVFALVAIAVILASGNQDNTPQGTDEPDSGTSSMFTSSTATSEATPAQDNTATPTEASSTPLPAAATQNGHIAFVSDRDSELYDIYLLNLEDQSTTLLWTNPYTEAYLAWSPDGALLSFTSWTSPDYIGDIYTLRPATSRFVNLTNNTFEDQYARWSPDGTQLVFESDRNDNVDLWVMNADGTQQTNISNTESWDHEAAWSPDGEQIVFASDRSDIMQLWIMNVDGSELVNLTPENAHFGQPAWSPDGTRIVYSRCVLPSPCNYEEAPGTEDNWDIWVMNADGSEAIQLTDNPNSDVAPTWSPEGTQIAFVSYREGNADIFVMNADGSEQTNVTNHPAEDYGPAWRP